MITHRPVKIRPRVIVRYITAKGNLSVNEYKGLSEEEIEGFYVTVGKHQTAKLRRKPREWQNPWNPWPPWNMWRRQNLPIEAVVAQESVDGHRADRQDLAK